MKLDQISQLLRGQGTGLEALLVRLGGALEASPHMPSVDYDGFLKATLAITHSLADVEKAFRRMVFNILAHNRDDHVRQHAYLMDQRDEWQLAPAFDLTFSHGLGVEHLMAVMGEGRAITRNHTQGWAKARARPLCFKPRRWDQ